MNGCEWLRVALAFGIMAAVIPALRWLTRCAGAGAELSRKSVHMALGFGCMALPWWFHSPLSVWVFAACATLPLAALRIWPSLRQGVGSVLHGVDRISFGDICFAPAVATVYQLSKGNTINYVIPIAILTIADAAAALAGTRWGRRRYVSGSGTKTHLGSVVFALAAWCCTALPLALDGRADWPAAAMTGGVLALLAMMAEGMADRGFDNLVVPLLAAFVLERIVGLDDAALLGRMIVAMVLVVVTMTGSRWSTLDGGALLGASLLGYACAVVADWRFALPLLAVFSSHLIITRRHGLTDVFSHHLDTVLAYALSCLPWVLMVDRGWLDRNFCLVGISFATATHLALTDALTRLSVPGMARAPWFSIAKGWTVAATPGLFWVSADWRLWVSPAMIAIGTGLILTGLLRRFDALFATRLTAERYFMGALALVTSALSLFFIS